MNNVTMQSIQFAKFKRNSFEVRAKFARSFTYFGTGFHEFQSEVPCTSVEVGTKFDGNSFKVCSKFFC